MATIWTVVFRKSQFAPAFRQTGFAGTWEEASEEARRIGAEIASDDAQVWVIPSTDTHVEIEVSNGRGGTMIRNVKIAPTAEQKAAAKAREASVSALIAKAEGDYLAERILLGWAARHGVRNVRDAAVLAVESGMTWSAICFTQS
jgi:hypothetical protein